MLQYAEYNRKEFFDEETHVIARRVLFPTTLAPYASAVSNLLLLRDCFGPRKHAEQERSRNDIIVNGLFITILVMKITSKIPANYI